MKKLYAIALTGCALAMSQTAFAEVVYVTNSADAASKDGAVTAVKEKLSAACKERAGKPDIESFEVTFEKKSPNPDVPKPYYVDAKMKCDLP